MSRSIKQTDDLRITRAGLGPCPGPVRRGGAPRARPPCQWHWRWQCNCAGDGARRLTRRRSSGHWHNLNWHVPGLPSTRRSLQGANRARLPVSDSEARQGQPESRPGSPWHRDWHGHRDGDLGCITVSVTVPVTVTAAAVAADGCCGRSGLRVKLAVMVTVPSLDPCRWSGPAGTRPGSSTWSAQTPVDFLAQSKMLS